MKKNLLKDDRNYKKLISAVTDNIIEISKKYKIKKIWVLCTTYSCFNKTQLHIENLEELLGKDTLLKIQLYINREADNNLLPIQINDKWLIDEIFIENRSYIIRIKEKKEYDLRNYTKEDMFRTIFENTKTGLAIYDVKNNGQTSKDYILKECNKVSLDLSGRAKRDSIGKSINDMIEDVDNTTLIPALKEVYETGRFKEVDAINFKSGHWYKNDIMKLPTGEIVSAYSDVTKIKENNLILDKIQRDLKEYTDKAPYGIFVVNKKGYFLQANKKAVSLTEYTERELKSKHMIDLFEETEVKQAYRMLKELKKKKISMGIFKHVDKKGKIQYWHIKGIRLDEQRYLGYVEDITAKRKIEEELRKSEKQFKLFFEKAPLGYQSLNINGYILNINEKWSSLLGYTKKEVIGKRFGDFLQEEDKNKFSEYFSKFKKLGTRQSIIKMVHKNGSIKMFQIYGNIIRDSNNIFVKTQCMLQDVTEQVKYENIIKEREEILRETQQVAHVGSFKYDLLNNQMSVSNEFYRILGYKPQEVKAISEIFINAIVAEDKKIFFKMREIKATSNNYIERELRIKDRQNKIKWVLLRGYSKLDENKKPVIIYGTLIDINEQKKIRKQIDEQNRLYEKAEQVTKIGTFEKNWINGNHTWSKGMYDIMEINPKQHIENKAIIYYTHSDDKERVQKQVEESIKNKVVLSIDFKIITKYKKIKYLHTELIHFYDNNGKINSSIGIVQDLSEKAKVELRMKKMEAALIDQQKLEAIGILASGIAHEINNPINGVMNYGQIILDQSKDNEKIAKYANDIIKESQRISKIVKNLLSFSRRERKTYSLVKIEDIINETLMLIKTVVLSENIELTIDIEKELPLITCNRQQIQQVIINLLTNAKDAVSQNKGDKKVAIKCYKTYNNNKEYIRCNIQDNGKGIDKEIEDKIFNPFFSTKTKDEGIGLGLFVSHKIIKVHDGRLEFKSIKGKFTEMYFDLPIDKQT